MTEAIRPPEVQHLLLWSHKLLQAQDKDALKSKERTWWEEGGGRRGNTG